MSLRRWMLCALLLALVGTSLAVPHLDRTSYGGWPALGFAIALFLMAGPRRMWHVIAAQVVVVSIALMIGYGVPLWSGLLGSLAVILPAWFAQRALVSVERGHLRLDEVDSGRYHLVTALTALLCGAASLVATITRFGTGDVLLVGLMSFLASLTAQLAVLPLLIRGSARAAAGSPVELWIQRAALLLSVVMIFGPTTRLAVVFVLFPMLGWAANRATRRETHWQLFLVCIACYALTLNGRGPFTGVIEGVPQSLNPALVYVFMAAACYMTVPLTMTVERLVSMTRQATRAATTVQRLLDSVSGALIIATDAQGRITHFNAGAQETLGYTPEEVLGKQPSMFHSPGELEKQAQHFGVSPVHAEISLAMVRRGERRDWEFTRKDGCPRVTSLTLSEVTDADGQVIGYIGAGDDITDRLRAQAALVTALDREHASVLRLEEVDQVKQELVSNVSHELRTPITSISGYAELLSDGSFGELSSGQVDAVRRIGRNTRRLELLVEDLLTLSKAESGQLALERTEVDLRTVASEAYEMLEEVLRVRTLTVEVVLPREPVLVRGDVRALERVVTNLMGNAIKFTPDHGRVSLSVRQTEREAALVVCDTGMGIPPEAQQHLFTRFYRAPAATKEAIQGTGLGLSIVHSIVTHHGGTVVVDSSPGTGTEVTVLLPRLAGS